VQSNYRDALNDDESLAHFLNAMGDFDREFCNALASNADFTLKLEIHGNQGKMIHARVTSDKFRRPDERKSVNRRNSV
jgi:hypothetical protein